MSQLLSAHSISFHYPGSADLHLPDIELGVAEQALLLGSSGSGKTTYLHLIAGLLRPHSGKLMIDGTDIYSLGERQLDAFRGQNIGIVFQVPHFLRALSVTENIAMAQRLVGKNPDLYRIDELLTELGLAAKRDQKIHHLSQGEKQRVSIIRALINKPRLILADEPTSALDDKNCTSVINMLKEQATAQGSALLVVTHDHRLSKEFDQKIQLAS